MPPVCKRFETNLKKSETCESDVVSVWPLLPAALRLAKTAAKLVKDGTKFLNVGIQGWALRKPFFQTAGRLANGGADRGVHMSSLRSATITVTVIVIGFVTVIVVIISSITINVNKFQSVFSSVVQAVVKKRFKLFMLLKPRMQT